MSSNKYRTINKNYSNLLITKVVLDVASTGKIIIYIAFLIKNYSFLLLSYLHATSKFNYIVIIVINILEI